MNDDEWTALTPDQKVESLRGELTALIQHVNSLGEKINRLQQRMGSLEKGAGQKGK